MDDLLADGAAVGIQRAVADAARYLASDLADYVNGESLVVDGGPVNTGYSRRNGTGRDRTGPDGTGRERG